MRTYILAARYAIARLAAEKQGINPGDWRYISQPSQALGLRPSDDVKLLRVWSPGVPFGEAQLAVYDLWEDKGYEVEVVTT